MSILVIVKENACNVLLYTDCGRQLFLRIRTWKIETPNPLSRGSDDNLVAIKVTALIGAGVVGRGELLKCIEKHFFCRIKAVLGG